MASSEQDSLKAAIFQRLHPRVYLERFVAEKIRPDGREFSDWRQASVNLGSISTADGSALVRLGSTTVVCGVKAEIAEPELERPHEGYLVPNFDLPALCSPKFKPGPPSEEAQILSDKLNEALLASGMLSLSSLCIHPGRAVWVLYVDAMCINYDGNAFDAALLSMVAALRNTKLPKAIFDEDTGKTTCSRRESRVPLELDTSRIPISSSFGIFDSSHILSDPTAFEEPLLDSALSVVLSSGSADDDVILVSQHGSSATSSRAAACAGGDAFSVCIRGAKERKKHLFQVLCA
ncbi:Ribosomal protein S5 domain 2-type fold [Amanita muscaria]